jgi:hypothetical protein
MLSQRLINKLFTSALESEEEEKIIEVLKDYKVKPKDCQKKPYGLLK